MKNFIIKYNRLLRCVNAIIGLIVITSFEFDRIPEFIIVMLFVAIEEFLFVSNVNSTNNINIEETENNNTKE